MANVIPDPMMNDIDLSH